MVLLRMLMLLLGSGAVFQRLQGPLQERSRGRLAGRAYKKGIAPGYKNGIGEGTLPGGRIQNWAKTGHSAPSSRVISHTIY